MRVTRTLPGRALSRSANKRDHEHCFRPTSVSPALSARCCSVVSVLRISSARLLSASASWRNFATSCAAARAWALVSKVHLAMNTSAMTEKSVTIAVTVHGNARLRKGVLERFSLVITTNFHERIHAARKSAQTHSGDHRSLVNPLQRRFTRTSTREVQKLAPRLTWKSGLKIRRKSGLAQKSL